MDGRLQPDPKKFPSGLKALSDRLGGMGEVSTSRLELAFSSRAAIKQRSSGTYTAAKTSLEGLITTPCSKKDAS